MARNRPYVATPRLATDEIELGPCPLCDSACGLMKHPSTFSVSVFCVACGLATAPGTLTATVEHWNQRPMKPSASTRIRWQEALSTP